MHYLMLEEFDGERWVYLGKVQCDCQIGENHWKERPAS